MGKDAQVTGLTMSATTADGLEVSLGELYSSGTTPAKIGDATEIPSIAAPCKDSLSWKQAIEFSEYYDVIGQLMPASSSTGLEMFYVDNTRVGGGGTTVEDGAAIYQANWIDTTGSTYTAKSGKLSSGTNYNTSNAVLELAESTSTKSLTTVKDSDGSVTGTFSGYYVDIPMWIRTSSQETNQTGDSAKDISVYCAVKITDPDVSSTEDPNLINAVRVAIIPLGDSATQTTGSGDNVTNATPSITLANSYADSINTSNKENAQASSSGESVTIFGLDDTTYRSASSASNGAIESASTFSGTTMTEGTGYSASKLAAQTVNKDATVGSNSSANTITDENTTTKSATVFALPTAEDQNYAVQAFVVRVWIEGESKYCNDTTADQNWNIDMFFSSDNSNDNAYNNAVAWSTSNS